MRGFWFAPGEDLEAIARDWCEASVRPANRERCRAYVEVRYEDLVLETEQELRRMCEFLELGFDARMLRCFETAGERLREIGFDNPDPLNPLPKLAAEPPDASRVYGWRRAMRRRDRRKVERVAGAMLEELGYS